MFILFLTKNYKVQFNLRHNSAIHFKTKRRTHTYHKQAYSQKLCILNKINKCWSCHISEALNTIVKYVIDFDVFIIRAKQWCLLSLYTQYFILISDLWSSLNLNNYCPIRTILIAILNYQLNFV